MSVFTDVDEYVSGQVKTAGMFGSLGQMLFSPISGLARGVKTVGTAASGAEGAVGAVGNLIKQHPYATAGAVGTAIGGNALHTLITNKLRAREQDEIFSFVKKDDPILREADRTELASAFDTFRAFAPTLATDPNATRSFLRQAVTSGGGVDYNTINLLARTEAAIQGDSNDR